MKRTQVNHMLCVSSAVYSGGREENRRGEERREDRKRGQGVMRGREEKKGGKGVRGGREEMTLEH